MLSKEWPDPECPGPHKEGQRLIRWQHTTQCKLAAKRENMVSADLGEMLREDNLPEDSTIVERARAVGAI